MRYFILFSFLGLTLLYAKWQKDRPFEGVDLNSLNQTNTLVKHLPEVTFKSFLEDKTINKEFFLAQGKPFILHFWASWCAPCEKEFPPLLRLSKLFEGEIDFYYVAVNDTTQDMKKFFKRFGSRFEDAGVLIDNNQEHRVLLGVSKVPETFLFSSEGQVLRRFVGPQEWDRSGFSNYLKSQIDQ